MAFVRFSYTLRDGSADGFLVRVSDADVEVMKGSGDEGSEMVRRRIEQAAEIDNFLDFATSWKVEFDVTPEVDLVPKVGRAQAGLDLEHEPPAVARSRSVLARLNRLLPPSDRQDALDEWMDEIETAAEEGLPVRRRAISIVLRTLPVLAIRSRLPARVRRGGG